MPTHSLWRHCNNHYSMCACMKFWNKGCHIDNHDDFQPDNNESNVHALAQISVQSLGMHFKSPQSFHYSDIIMCAMVSQITSLTIVYLTISSGTDQRKHQNSMSLASVRNLPVTGEFPAQRSSDAENVSIWWRHHVTEMAILLQGNSLKAAILTVMIAMIVMNSESP